MTDYDYESKMLHLEIKENEDKYISGELPLDEPLKRTEELFDYAFEAAKKHNASKFSHDSGLMQLQSKIVRQRAKSYKPDTLVFDAREFSEKLKRYFTSVVSNDDRNKRLSNQHYSMIWQKLGEESEKKMHIAPTFDFLYGTFSAEPASPVKKKRKRIEKDKVVNAVKPKTVDMSECSEKKDGMLDRSTRIFTFLTNLLHKSGQKSMCFYEFVIDPQSFSRTIENIFSVTFLLRNGNVCIFSDEQGLPCIGVVTEEERKERIMDPKETKQSVLSMSFDEWKTIIRKCKFTGPKIRPQK